MDTDTIKVVMLIDAWFPNQTGAGQVGGVQVHVKRLRKQLEAAFPCEIELFYMAHPNPVIRYFWPFIGAIQVLQYLKLHPAHLIHTHGTLSAIAGKLVSLVSKLPIIHTVHATASLDLKRRTPMAFIERLILTKVPYDSQISVSQNFLKYANVNQNLTVIPNGVDINEFNQVRVKKHDQPTLIWVGKNTHEKGLDILKEAIARVRKKYPDLRSELVTNGRLMGRELITAYKKAHLFVLPSRSEAHPISLLEAWAAKLPVVVTNVGDNEDMVEDGVNGYLVEPDNVSQLASSILKILRARVTDERMGQAGYELVKRRYSWEQVAERTFLVYQDLKDHMAKETRLSGSPSLSTSSK